VETCERDGAATKPTLAIDQLVAQRYRLLKRLGRGSISVVYQALDEHSGTECALKIILPEYAGNNAADRTSFLSHAANAFALRHPHIAAVTDAGMIGESFPFLVMDLITGPSFDRVLSRSGGLSPWAAFEYLNAIGAALSHAHAKGIVHGDLKPRNILLVDEQSGAEAIRITDFGLAAIKAGKLQGAAPEASGVVRSPMYLAPEEWSEEQSDARSDIYSLGVILYHMLTGAAPFDGKSNAAIMKSHLKDPPPPFAGRFAGVTVEIENAVLHALEKEPAKRPASVDEFVSEFRDALASAPPDYGVAEDVVRENRWATVVQPILLALGVVLVITLIGIGVYYSRMSQ
jgi:serine/threonine-protein kinase